MLLIITLSCIFILPATSMPGSRIVYPNEATDLFEKLGLADDTSSIITTRFSFPGDAAGCTTREGQRGDCISFNQCPELQDFVRERGGIRNREDIQFLRRRICSLARNNVKLCCLKKTADNLSVNSTSTTTGPVVMLPSMDQCGFSVGGRITDGIEIMPNSHPWLVGVGFPRDNLPFRVLCGGTLITKRHVISAAHCFVRNPGIPELTHVRLGEHSLSMDNERMPAFNLRIISKKNPGYNRVSHVNDLELLVLERDVAFTRATRPACLPFGFQERTFENEIMTIVGWGDTFHRSLQGSDVPLAANISVISKPICKEAYKVEPQVPFDKTQFCAGQGAKDACQGDSGGPLLFNDLTEHNRVFLMGVVSFGVECANEAFPGVYTFIPEFLNWIRDNL